MIKHLWDQLDGDKYFSNGINIIAIYNYSKDIVLTIVDKSNKSTYDYCQITITKDDVYVSTDFDLKNHQQTLNALEITEDDKVALISKYFPKDDQ